MDLHWGYYLVDERNIVKYAVFGHKSGLNTRFVVFVKVCTTMWFNQHGVTILVNGRNFVKYTAIGPNMGQNAHFYICSMVMGHPLALHGDYNLSIYILGVCA